MIKQNQKHYTRIFVFLDILVIFISLQLSWFVRFKSNLFYVPTQPLSYSQYMFPMFFIIPIYVILYSIFNLYKPRRIQGAFVELLNLIKANVVGILMFIFTLYMLKNIDYSRILLAIFLAINISFNYIVRLSIIYFSRYARTKGLNVKHVLMVGYSNVAESYIDRIKSNPNLGYHIHGILDDNKKINYTYNGIKITSKIDDLKDLLDEKSLDEVVITLKIEEYDKLESIVALCEKSGVHTKFIPDYYRYIPTKPYIDDMNGLPIINIRQVPLNDLMNKSVKRLIDIIGALFAIILFSPIMIFTAITIKITSPGPIIFKQERVGLNKKNFNMYKFRSMKIVPPEQEKLAWTTSNDPRVTKFGSFIRKTSLDELPQFFNVLIGDMSLIGPRPERPLFVEKFKEEIPKYMIKHQVRPGITGWAQVNGYRGDTSIKKRIEHDLYYIENWTLGLDIKILLLTFFKGFVHKNAY